MMYLHRRQFLIGPQKFMLNESWKAYPVNDSTWLSCCPDLQILKAVDANGNAWYLLGLAVETLDKKVSPEREIARTQSAQVPDLYASWAGRWALVSSRHCHLDASGLLGCFYGHDSEGHLWASSSAALVAQVLFSGQSPEIDPRRLSYEAGISWYTPPCSRFAGISRLLPSQVLDLQSGKILPRPLMPEICLERDYEDILQQIQQRLVTTLQQLAQLNTELWLGLTAGYDSRLMLALSERAGIPVRPFTRITARMSVADRILPPKLAEVCQFTHIFIRNQHRYPERKRLAELQTACHVSEGDAEPFIQGIRDNLSGIAFGGHGFSVASGFAQLHTLPDAVTSAEDGARQIAHIFQEPVESSATAGIQRWLLWALEHPQKNLNWRDRAFIEQRQAGWLSSKEQLYDLTDLTRFPILNSAYLYSLLLSVRAEKRVGSSIQEDLLRQLNPQLIQYPFNPGDFYFNPLDVLTCKAQHLPQYIRLKFLKKTRSLWNSFMLRY
ncbi:MAG: hypothetical protein F6J95_008080 [Leptolyngbya sp. SIO1E4]|nr:hypothetical protein [Leptolyngbya sp. SIO1E4]